VEGTKYIAGLQTSQFGPGSVVSVTEAADGLPRVLIDPEDTHGAVAVGRWVLVDHDDIARTAQYREG
jgi:hypothetical protein